jgi:hypothetical protein
MFEICVDAEGLVIVSGRFHAAELPRVRDVFRGLIARGSSTASAPRVNSRSRL